MPKVSCAAACRHADVYREICTKEDIRIVYRNANLDWPCRDFEPRRVSPMEFAKCLLTTSGINPNHAFDQDSRQARPLKRRLTASMKGEP